MQAFLIICIGLLLASCGGKEQPKSTVAAIESGEKTRMEWQKSRKPVEIHIEAVEGITPARPHFGIYGRKRHHTRRKASICRNDVHPKRWCICVGKQPCRH